jgi:hypothetical protein
MDKGEQYEQGKAVEKGKPPRSATVYLPEYSHKYLPVIGIAGGAATAGETEKERVGRVLNI